MVQSLHGYSITVATNLQEIEKIRNAWEGMQTHPNSDIDHFINVIAAKSNVIRPHVVLLTQNNRPVSLVVGRIEKQPFEFKLGYKKIHGPTVQSFSIVYGGLLGDLSVATCMILINEFMMLLKREHVDMIRFNYLNVASPMYDLIARVPNAIVRDRFPVVNTHWRMSVPNSIELFYKSRKQKHRYWFRRIERLLDKDHPNQVQHLTHTTSEDLDNLFRDLETVARKTYQRGLRVGFVDNAQTRQIYERLTQKGCLRSYLTYIKDEPSAFWTGECYGDTFYLYSTGYDPLYKQYELGTILFLKMLEDLCNLGNIRYLDFGFGDHHYKSRFGDYNWQEATVHIFASHLSGFMLSMLHHISSGGYQLSMELLRKLKVLEKVKQYRRSRVARVNGYNNNDDKHET